jgi:hypothetical protein
MGKFPRGKIHEEYRGWKYVVEESATIMLHGRGGKGNTYTGVMAMTQQFRSRLSPTCNYQCPAVAKMPHCSSRSPTGFLLRSVEPCKEMKCRRLFAFPVGAGLQPAWRARGVRSAPLMARITVGSGVAIRSNAALNTPQGCSTHPETRRVRRRPQVRLISLHNDPGTAEEVAKVRKILRYRFW